MKKASTARDLNFRVARRLEEVAQLLESQGGNPFLVDTYRRAAETDPSD